MTVVLRAAPTGGGGGSGTSNANNHRGAVTGLAPTASTTLVSFATAGIKLRGFTGYGDRDGLFWLELDGVPIEGMVARSSIVKKAEFVLPNPETLVGTTLVLKVRNETDVATGGAAGAYEGVVLGE